MRILVVGAGATGGYFGGRLAQVGCDVTFLVRARRAQQLAKSGLTIKSAFGDAHLPLPRTIQSEQIAAPYDVILLSCKAYDLDGAIESFAAAVGSDTVVLPVLNGMRHLDVLDARFGRERILGGLCVIAATVDDGGVIVHLNKAHSVAFGERDGTGSPRCSRIADAMAKAQFESRLSATIVHDMWEKWVFLATLAGSTCAMRAAIGDILAAPRGKELITALYDECRQIAAANGFAPRPPSTEQALKMLTQEGSELTASMLRDIERGARIEADHIVGDLLSRQSSSAVARAAVLEFAFAHLKAYEARNASKVCQ